MHSRTVPQKLTEVTVMTNTYYMVFIIALVVAIVFFITGIVLFFMFNIPKIIGILTGYTARKQIKHIQNSRSSVSNSDHLDSFMDEQRNIAQKVKHNPISIPRSRTSSLSNGKTETLPLSQVRNNSNIRPVNQTEQNQTVPLPQIPDTAETTALETEFISQPQTSATMPETTYLEDDKKHITEEIQNSNVRFDIVFSLEFINTDETI